MRMTSAIATLSLAALTPLSAYAQTAGTRMESAADRTGARAHDQAKLADDWKDGERMVATGNRLVTRSERRIAEFARDASKHQARADRAAADGVKAQASLAEGQRMIEEGRRMKAQAEARFPQVPAA